MVKLTGGTSDDRAMANKSEEQKYGRPTKKEAEEQLKLKRETLLKQIEEAIARGKDWKPPKKGHWVEPVGIGQPMFIDEPRDIRKRMPKSLMVYKGDLLFERKVRYECEQGSYQVRRKADYYMISTLAKDLHVRGQVIVDKYGEPKYLMLNPMGDVGKKLVYTIKLTGSLFTKQQKRQFKAEVRSKKIEELQKKLDQAEKKLKSANESVEQLRRELANCVRSKLKNKLRKLVGKDEELTEQQSTS